MQIIKNNKSLGLKFIYLLDILLLIMITAFFINDFFSIIFTLSEKILDLINLNDIISNISNNANDYNNITTSINTIFNLNEISWNNNIISLYIYGSSIFLLYFSRNDIPRYRFAIISGALLGDYLGKFISNILND